MSELKGCDSYDLPVDVCRCGDDERREREREAGKSNGENKKNKKTTKETASQRRIRRLKSRGAISLRDAHQPC